MSDRFEGRRRWLKVAGSVVAGSALARVGLGSGTEPDRSPAEASASGRRFLTSLFDASVGLLPEFPGSKVYWLYHDNYLAVKVLEATAPELAGTIRRAIRGFGVAGSGKIEILFGEATKPLPFRHYRLQEVGRVGEQVIRTEVVGEEIHRDWRRYTDLLFFAAIARAEADREQASADFEAGMETWDGSGFRDLASAKGGLSATYKLALALIAGDRVARKPGRRAEIVARLLAMQRPDGGFVTDYDAEGRKVGQANVETTALAILALDDPIKGRDGPGPRPSGDAKPPGGGLNHRGGGQR